MSTGENSREAAASAADGARPATAVNLIRCGGRHTLYSKLGAIIGFHVILHIIMSFFISYGGRGVSGPADPRACQ